MLENVNVLKFGGTSVKSIGRIQHVCHIIDSKRRAGPVIVVVSAMGDTTDYLIKLAGQASVNPDKRELDLLLSTGEQISITLVAMVLRDMGIKAKSYTASQVGIFTESVFSKARIVDVKTETIIKAFEENEVIVVAGFQGVTSEGDITTLGRGGSDTTAVALAAAVKAKVCDIYTDVDGIYTADPNVVKDARRLDRVSYDEVVEMARLGAQVIHPRAVELARQYNVVLHVRNTFKPQDEGTTIEGGKDMEIYRTIRGVAIDKDQATVAIMDVPDRPGIAGKIMSAVAAKNIIIDMIMQGFHPKLGVNNMNFTVSREDLNQTVEILSEMKEELGASLVEADTDIAKVSVIGAGMVHQPGIAARLFTILGEAGINIKMIGTSEMKLTCVISRDDAERAAQLIHKEFQLEKPAQGAPE